jgi:hypothetical protein
MAEVDDGTLSDEELEDIREQADELLRQRRDLLNQVGRTYTSYISALGDLDVAAPISSAPRPFATCCRRWPGRCRRHRGTRH